jgi:hypothetical protein
VNNKEQQMDAVYNYVGMAVVWTVIAAIAIAAIWLVCIYSVGFVRSVRFVLWLDRNARKDPVVGLTRWQVVRGVFQNWHDMTVFNPKTDTIQIRSGETFRG